MVMDKRGYVRILEAIIALIIVLAYVVSILPKAQQPTGQVPQELLSLQKVVFDEVQNDQEFRTCVVYGKVYVAEGDVTKTDMQCVNELVSQSLPPFSAWRYAFRICEKGGTKQICNYADPSPGKEGEKYDGFSSDEGVGQEREFSEKFFPPTSAVYTKSVFVSVADVTSAFTVTKDNADSENGKFKVITLYVWSVV